MPSFYIDWVCPDRSQSVACTGSRKLSLVTSTSSPSERLSASVAGASVGLAYRVYEVGFLLCEVCPELWESGVLQDHVCCLFGVQI